MAKWFDLSSAIGFGFGASFVITGSTLLGWTLFSMNAATVVSLIEMRDVPLGGPGGGWYIPGGNMPGGGGMPILPYAPPGWSGRNDEG